MFELLMPTYNFLATYVQKLAADVPDERMCEQPVAGRGMNHAAWTLGHLAYVNDAVAGMLGGVSANPPEWKELFAPGSKPLDDRSKYPSKAELMAAVEASHHRLGEAARAATPEALAAPAPERMRNRFPTMGNMAAGLMTGHYANHLGQLSAWRRSIGLPSVL